LQGHSISDESQCSTGPSSQALPSIRKPGGAVIWIRNGTLGSVIGWGTRPSGVRQALLMARSNRSRALSTSWATITTALFRRSQPTPSAPVGCRRPRLADSSLCSPPEEAARRGRAASDQAASSEGCSEYHSAPPGPRPQRCCGLRLPRMVIWPWRSRWRGPQVVRTVLFITPVLSRQRTHPGYGTTLNGELKRGIERHGLTNQLGCPVSYQTFPQTQPRP